MMYWTVIETQPRKIPNKVKACAMIILPFVLKCQLIALENWKKVLKVSLSDIKIGWIASI